MQDKDAIGIAGVDYLMYAGYVQMAYHWLKMEVRMQRTKTGRFWFSHSAL